MAGHGCCGGGVILLGKTYYGCSAVRNKGTCDNRQTIGRKELEDRVLSGLRDQLLHPDLIAEFVRASHEEFNSLALSHQKIIAASRRSLQRSSGRLPRSSTPLRTGCITPR